MFNCEFIWLQSHGIYDLGGDPAAVAHVRKLPLVISLHADGVVVQGLGPYSTGEFWLEICLEILYKKVKLKMWTLTLFMKATFFD